MERTKNKPKKKTPKPKEEYFKIGSKKFVRMKIDGKVRTFPVVKPTAWEKKAIERSRRAIARGDFITLEELQRELDTKKKK